MLPVYHKTLRFSKSWVTLLLCNLLWVQVLPEHPFSTLWQSVLGNCHKGANILDIVINVSNKVFVYNPGALSISP